MLTGPDWTHHTSRRASPRTVKSASHASTRAQYSDGLRRRSSLFPYRVARVRLHSSGCRCGPLPLRRGVGSRNSLVIAFGSRSSIHYIDVWKIFHTLHRYLQHAKTPLPPVVVAVSSLFALPRGGKRKNKKTKKQLEPNALLLHARPRRRVLAGHHPSSQ